MLRNSHMDQEYRWRGKVQGTKRGHPAQNLIWRCHGVTKCGRASFKSHAHGLREHWEHWSITTSLLLWDQHLPPHFLQQAATCLVWRAGRSQGKARTSYAMLGLCVGRQSGGSRVTATCLSTQPKGVRKPCCAPVVVWGAHHLPMVSHTFWQMNKTSVLWYSFLIILGKE